ncbi:MAG: ABC transporter permease [Lachnospiraceae bacterium]|nr:ABC transporter permease [Lachnospiraceae bacterium]
MAKYIGKRLLQMIPVLLGLTFLTFLLLYLSPGDPAEKKLKAQGVAVSDEIVEQVREEMGLNRPFLVQYADWLVSALHGDLGTSYKDERPVAEKLTDGMGNTLILSLASLFLALIVSVPLALYTAVRKNRFSDYLIRFLSFIGNSVPSFLLSVLLIYFFCIRLKWFPVIAKGTVQWLFLPTLALAIPLISRFIRQFRAEFLEQLSQEYVIGARVRGVKEHLILFCNVLHNSMMPILTIVGLSVGTLMGGSVVIETIFMWPGLGKLVMDSITARDYPVIQGFVILMAVLYVGINLVIDICYRVFDPRMRDAES